MIYTGIYNRRLADAIYVILNNTNAIVGAVGRYIIDPSGEFLIKNTRSFDDKLIFTKKKIASIIRKYFKLNNVTINEICNFEFDATIRWNENSSFRRVINHNIPGIWLYAVADFLSDMPAKKLIKKYGEETINNVVGQRNDPMKTAAIQNIIDMKKEVLMNYKESILKWEKDYNTAEPKLHSEFQEKRYLISDVYLDEAKKLNKMIDELDLDIEKLTYDV